MLININSAEFTVSATEKVGDDMLGQLNCLDGVKAISSSSYKDKIETAIDRFRMFEPAEGYWLAFSGGKDSIVIKELANMAGVKYDAHYNLTTVDPPELIRYIKKYHQDVIFEYPEISMWNLIPQKSMPPTRKVRYCCEILKEHGGEGRFTVTGVRWAESSRRKQTRDMVEVNFKERNKKGGISRIILNGDNDDLRRMVESCVIKSKHVLNPIIDWTDNDIWEFIKIRNLQYCELYDQGFKRLGCIGCPMQGSRGMNRDFRKWPKYKEAYLRAFKRMIDMREQKELGNKYDYNTPEKILNWWVNR